MKDTVAHWLSPEKIRASYVRRFKELQAVYEKAVETSLDRPHDRRAAYRVRRIDRDMAKIVAEVHRLSRLIESQLQQ